MWLAKQWAKMWKWILDVFTDEDPAKPKKTPLKGHKASFLWDNAATRCMNMFSPGCDRARFEAAIGRMKAMGCNMAYAYTVNAADGPWGFSLYTGDNLAGNLDAAKLAEFKSRVTFCRKAGLGVVFWLMADDSSKYARLPLPTLQKYVREVVGLLSDDASGFVVGLEADEYWNQNAITTLVAAAKAESKVPVGVHYRPGRVLYAGDVLFYQYGFGKSAKQIEAETRNVIGRCGSPVVAAEYHKSGSRSLSEAALRGGAYGVGNWA